MWGRGWGIEEQTLKIVCASMYSGLHKTRVKHGPGVSSYIFHSTFTMEESPSNLVPWKRKLRLGKLKSGRDLI